MFRENVTFASPFALRGNSKTKSAHFRRVKQIWEGRRKKSTKNSVPRIGVLSFDANEMPLHPLGGLSSMTPLLNFRKMACRVW